MHQRNSWLIGSAFTLAALLLVTAGLLATGLIAPSVESTSAQGYTDLVQRSTTDGAPVLGDPSASQIVVIFLDYACAHCAEYSGTIRALVESVVRPGGARLEMRILSGLAPEESLLAARAALCAIDQNLFWEFQEQLFASRAAYAHSVFTTERIREIANQVGLDVEDLSGCMGNTASLDTRLQHNTDLALSVGVKTLPTVMIRRGNRTPGWILVDGQRQAGRVPLATIMDALQAGVQS